MSYKALYRKYRPNNFNTIVGQDHVITTLKNAVETGKLSHAYLFVGPHGTGKTTAAHVFAKSINCVDRHATDKFAMCETFDWSKGAMDIIEIDAASNNGVAEVRQLIENSRYAPTSLKYKVYIIDEVHMLSKGAFNALLKTLEEPPKHVVFVLATTEPGKVPPTVLSRVQRYNFRRISDNVIVKSLQGTLTQEGITYEELSLVEIAKQANGSLRDALSIADQTSAYGNGTITFEYISKAYGILSVETQLDLLLSVAHGNVKEMLSLTRTFFLEGIDLYRLTNSLLDIVKDWIIYNQVQDTTFLTVLTTANIEKLSVSKRFAYKASDILLKLTSDLKKTQSSKQAFELALLTLVNEAGSESSYKEIKPSDEIKVFDKPNPLVSPDVSDVIKHNLNPSLPKEEVIAMEELAAPKQEITQSILSDTLKKLNVALEETAEINVSEEIYSIESKENVSPHESTIMEDVSPPDEGINITDVLKEEELLRENTAILNSANEVPEMVLPTTATVPTNIPGTQHEETTEELDIGKLFDITADTALDTTAEIKTYSIDEIINVLLQSDKSDITNVRSRLNDSSQFVNEPTEQSYSVLLKSVKVIASGDKFILLSSETKTIIREINQLKMNDDFVQFVDKVLGKQVIVYAINRDQFEEVKQIWGEYSRENTLPEPKEIIIDRPKPETNKSQAETYAEDIFGDLFK